MNPPARPEPEFDATADRPASLWPESTRAGDLPSTGFANTRFASFRDANAPRLTGTNTSSSIAFMNSVIVLR